jgi:death-on-curing protein
LQNDTFYYPKNTKLHDFLIKETGGIDGVRDFGTLDSALQNPFLTFDLNDLYPSIEEKAARLCYSLISNHTFIDGNKRIGMLVMLTFF